MKTHLTPQEFVDALDGRLSPARVAHVRDCAGCRDEVAGLHATLGQARQVEISEPSPLFWDHFSARVRQATSELPARPPWAFGWRSLGAVASAVGVLVLALLINPAPVPNDTSTVSGGAQPVQELADEDGSLSLLVGLAAELDWSELSQVAAPAEGTADAMIEELTPEQREVLARLLQEEIGDL